MTDHVVLRPQRYANQADFIESWRRVSSGAAAIDPSRGDIDAIGVLGQEAWVIYTSAGNPSVDEHRDGASVEAGRIPWVALSDRMTQWVTALMAPITEHLTRWLGNGQAIALTDMALSLRVSDHSDHRRYFECRYGDQLVSFPVRPVLHVRAQQRRYPVTNKPNTVGHYACLAEIPRGYQDGAETATPHMKLMLTKLLYTMAQTGLTLAEVVAVTYLDELFGTGSWTASPNVLPGCSDAEFGHLVRGRDVYRNS